MSRTGPYRAWVTRYAQAQGLPLLVAPKDVRKEDLVAPYYRQFKAVAGVVVSLTSTEAGRTFVSSTPRYPPPSGDANYRLLHACRKRFLHYYLLCVLCARPGHGADGLACGDRPAVHAGVLPQWALVPGAGTHAAGRRRPQGRKDNNAFPAVDDLAALRTATERLTPRLIEQRCDYWARRLAPSFSATERAVLPLDDRYSVAQIELATDVIFQRSAPLRALFRRATELGILLGGADRTTHLFGRRITARDGDKLQTVLDRRNEGPPIRRSSYGSSFVKQYETGDRLLRTETCVNNTYDLGIGRRLEPLPELRDRLAATNTRYLEAQAEVLASTVDAGELAALGRSVVLGRRRVPGLKLEDDRVIRLLEALLHPGTFVADWTIREVHTRLLARHRLTEDAYRLGQLRHDLSKLRAHSLVERIGTSRRCRLTSRGLRLGVLLVTLRTRLLGPLVSLAAASAPRRSPALTSPAQRR